MSEEPERPTAPETTSPGAPLDLRSLSQAQTEKALRKYKTEELKERFQQLFGVVNLLPWAALGFLSSLAVALTIWAVIFATQVPWPIALLTLAYLVGQGFYLGLLAASLLVLMRVFQKLTAIIDLAIQSIRELFGDLSKLGDKQARAEIVATFVHSALIPTIQGVIAVKLGLLRAPIGFVINRLLGKTAKKLTKNLSAEVDHLPTERDLPGPDDAPPDTAVSATSSTSSTHLDRMQERIEVIARRTRRATMIPATLFFAITALISSIPWVILALSF